MSRKFNHFIALAMATIAASAGAQEASRASAASLLKLAATDYERGHWREAFAAFSALADRCEAEPARIAALMWRHGPALYRTEFSASREQIHRWAQLATEANDTGCIASTRGGLQVEVSIGR